ncbi:MAG: cytochrome c oxidase assembly protein [Chloroflexi bacterium]|nr:cytochrome c oxidase assembly protein [Chloroflexota bacterium]
MSSTNLWLTEWNFEPTVLVGLILLSAIYLYGVGPLRRRYGWAAKIDKRQIALFLSGVFIIFIALISPLDEIGDYYLFSAHMVQHLLLTLVMPPLLLLGTPSWLVRPLLEWRLIHSTARWVSKPILAFLLFNVLFTAYHVPTLYDLALQNEMFHIFVHLLLMATSVVAWLPILSPMQEFPRLPYPHQILYLFFGAILPTILGAIITFSDSVLYPTYRVAPRVFGISALDDQMAAGLIMWIPGSTIYLLVLTIVFFKWFGQDDGEKANEFAGRG